MVRRIAASLTATAAVVILVAALAIAVAVGWLGLSAAGATSLYFVIWWISLFAVLPFGVRSQIEAGEVVRGTEPGAPAAPRLREAALWTTVVAGALLIVAAALLPLAGL